MTPFKYTEGEKIVAVMALRRHEREWFKPHHVMDHPAYFVGYKAGARMTELQQDYPDMIESRPDGRFVERRVRYENKEVWWPKIPSVMKVLFENAGVTRFSHE